MAFLDDAGRKFSRCKLGNDQTCGALFEALNTACCAGEDGKFGGENHDDDTCNIPQSVPTIFDNVVCNGVVLSGAMQCPHEFITNSVLLGLYEDSGGSLDQLFAAEPVETTQAHYCKDSPHAYVDPNPGKRRLANRPLAEGKMTAELLAFYTEHPVSRTVPEVPGSTSIRNPRALQAIPPSPNSANCSKAYQEAFQATLPCTPGKPDCKNGDCSGAKCTLDCQKKITNMLTKCRDQTFTLDHDGTPTQYSFSQQAANALAMLGPEGCTYSEGFAECHAECTPKYIIDTMNEKSGDDTNVDDNCVNTFMGISFREWNGCSKVGGDHSHNEAHKQKCWDRYLGVVQKCSGCKNLFVQRLVSDFAVANAEPECESCAHPDKVAEKVHQLCCSGADGILGNSDDPCALHVTCTDLQAQPECDRGPRVVLPKCADGNVSQGGMVCAGAFEESGNTYLPHRNATCQRENGRNVGKGKGFTGSNESCRYTGDVFSPGHCSEPCDGCDEDPECREGEDDSCKEACERPPGADGSWGSEGARVWVPKNCSNPHHKSSRDKCELTHNTFKPEVDPKCQNTLGQTWSVPDEKSCTSRELHPKCEPASEFDSVEWYNPNTCQQDGVCKAFVDTLAKSGDRCTTTFLDNTQARRVYADCGGDLVELAAHGKPCKQHAFEKAFPGATGTPGHLSPPASSDPHKQASWGSCMNESSGRLHLASGDQCEMTCKTGYCVEGNQPYCLDGKIKSNPPMSCEVQPISTCSFPPNGGCDPHTTCDDSKPGLFMLKVVTCGRCPPGYYGTGRTSCEDINECMLRHNGGCDEHTVCTNLDGGYKCSDCPAGFSGDSFRVGGCCENPKTFVPQGQSGASCASISLVDNITESKSNLAIVLLIVLVVIICASGWGYLCSKKQYKDAGGKFEKIDVGSIGTGPSIYDSTWAR